MQLAAWMQESLISVFSARFFAWFRISAEVDKPLSINDLM